MTTDAGKCGGTDDALRYAVPERDSPVERNQIRSHHPCIPESEWL